MWLWLAILLMSLTLDGCLVTTRMFGNWDCKPSGKISLSQSDEFWAGGYKIDNFWIGVKCNESMVRKSVGIIRDFGELFDGCITILQRGSSSWQGHVGFYVGEEGDFIKLLGGNQHDSVCIANFPKSQVLDYRWPVGATKMVDDK